MKGRVAEAGSGPGRYSGVIALAALIAGLAVCAPAAGWSNGGRSADPADPDYGTHDWIAERAARMLPENESGYIFEHRAAFLYGTEIPDFVLQDTRDHHVYLEPDGSVLEDNAAVKARDAFAGLVHSLRAGDRMQAAERAGILTHYIADLAVFGHVMSSKTAWGEEKHHADFESDVDAVMKTPDAAAFPAGFDGALEVVDPFGTAIELARVTTFGDGTRTAAWMDDHYAAGLESWEPAFRARVQELIVLAVNIIADVLHSAVVGADAAASPPGGPAGWPTATPAFLLAVGAFVGLLFALYVALVARERRR